MKLLRESVFMFQDFWVYSVPGLFSIIIGTEQQQARLPVLIKKA
jgi:hypothetical protein